MNTENLSLKFLISVFFSCLGFVISFFTCILLSVPIFFMLLICCSFLILILFSFIGFYFAYCDFNILKYFDKIIKNILKI